MGERGGKRGKGGGRRLKTVMDIEVGEGDDGEEREQKEGGEIRKRIRGRKKGVINEEAKRVVGEEKGSEERITGEQNVCDNFGRFASKTVFFHPFSLP